MKRECNGSSHTAVFRCQPVKRGDGLGIAQDARDLPAAGVVGGLALGAGLGLHSGTQSAAERNEAALLNAELLHIGRTPHGAEAVGAGGAEKDGAEAAVLLNGDGLHFVSPKRANPADESSSHVTSDTSSQLAKEILNGGAA